MHSLLLLAVALLLISPARFSGPSRGLAAGAGEVVEDERWYDEPVATQPNDRHLVLNLDKTPGLLDVRGVGDSAWSFGARPASGSRTPRPATFDATLRQYDPRQDIFVGDLSFINLETVVGQHCERIRQSVDFYFLTSPQAVRQAVGHGFNLLGMANNHAQDCDAGRAYERSQTKHGPLMTEEALNGITGVNFAWAGVGQGENRGVTVKTFRVKGRAVRVALAALTFVSWAMPNTNAINFNADDVDEQVARALSGFSRAQADLRILSIHTQDGSGDGRREQGAFLALKRAAVRFITRYNGDVVFGHGPHTHGGVRLIAKGRGKHGVIFTSMGNFIHDGLMSNPDNYIGRAVYDFTQMKLTQIQVFPYRNDRRQNVPVNFYGRNQSNPSVDSINANFDWQQGGFIDHSGKRRKLFYADLP